MLRNKTRVALAGLGWFGRMHLEVWKQIDRVEIAAVCDPDPEAFTGLETPRTQDEFHQAVGTNKNENPLTGISCFSSVNEMLEKIKPDILDVTAPESCHFEIARQGIAHRCDVIVEKPFVLSYGQAQELAQEARRQGVKLYVGHVLRFDTRCRALASLLSGTGPDHLRHLSLERNFQARGHDVYGRTHAAFAACIHDIDLALWFSSQEVVSVSAVERSFLGRDNPDVVVAILEFASGALAVIQNVWHVAEGCPYGFEFQTKLFTRDDTYCIRNEPVIHHWSKEKTHYPEMFFWPHIDGMPQGALKEELRHFEHCSRRGCQSDIVPLAHVLESTRIAEALIKSAKTGQPVKLNRVEENK